MLSEKENPYSRYWKSHADCLWSKVVKQAGQCSYCETGRNLQAYHLIVRSYNTTRHNVKCGICLCRYHHLYCSKISPHLAPKAFEEWLKKKFPAKYRWVNKNKVLRVYSKVDFRAAFLKLSRRNL